MAAEPITIGHLGGNYLGVTGAMGIEIDATAAGFGWYIGAPAGNNAFSQQVAPTELMATPGSPAYGRMDLLTVVTHEFGHVLGLGDVSTQLYPDALMAEELPPGVRRLPSVGRIADAAGIGQIGNLSYTNTDVRHGFGGHDVPSMGLEQHR